MEHEDAFDRLTEDLDPYHQFLRFGHVSATVSDPDEWRAELRRQARRDKIPFHSFVVGRDPGGGYCVWAGKARKADSGQVREIWALMSVQHEATSRAALYGHEKVVWIRVMRGEKAAGRCERCGGRVYVSRLTKPPIMDGDVFERRCST
jgi:hypothetical protein